MLYFRQYFSQSASLIASERPNFILWLPVFFSSGIIYYFSLAYEPRLLMLILILTINSLAIYLTHQQQVTYCLSLAILAFSLGIACSTLRAANTKNIMLGTQLSGNISGKIESIMPLEKGTHLILSNIHIKNLKTNYTPIKIRLTTRSDVTKLQASQVISFYGKLTPPPDPVIPGGYDFARSNWFKQIGAVGYNLSPLTVETELLPKNSLQHRIDNFRLALLKEIIGSLGKRTGYIASALLIGEYNAIPKDILSSMRKSGLTHILSVSGLHLSMVAAIFFFSFRVLLNLYQPIALNYNIKKLASICAVLGSFGYLLISGQQIAASRAFIMTSIIILAIIIDRHPTPMRSVLAAAMLLLFLSPEQIINPSFQMSFAAVIALFAAYECCLGIFRPAEFTIISYVLRYLAAAIISSSVAGLATAPFAAYHFHQYSSYSLLANLLAAPLISLVIMPSVVLCFLLLPFGLLKLGLIPLGLGIELLIKIAEVVANLPGSMLLLPHMPNYCLLLIVSGGLWLCLWQRSWRLLGVLPILLGLLLMFIAKQPDLLIDQKGSFAFKSESSELVFFDKSASRYIREEWLKYFGQAEAKYYTADTYPELKCNLQECDWQKNGQMRKIDRASFAEYGAAIVFLTDHGVEVVKARQKNNRPWNMKLTQN